MSAALSSPLQDLIALAQEPSSRRRRELLRRVTDLFLAHGGARPAGETEAFDQLFCKLAADMEVEVRAEFAERFTDATSCPAALAARLARDCIEVALPILSNANLLTEADLLDLARTQGQEHLRAVSARPGLSEAISDVIVERGDDETLDVLVRNDEAALSRQASEAIVERAHANPALHAGVVGRAALPLDLVNEMYFVVEARLRSRILARNAAADPKVVDAALAAARARLAARAVPSDEALLEADAEAGRTEARGRLTPATLLAWLRAGQRPLFIAGLARLADIESNTLCGIVDRGDFDAFAIVCKAADLDKSLFLTFAVLSCATRDAMSKASAYGKLYTDLPREAALRTLRFWRIRREGDISAAA